jgi:25S rRNA (uracil2634-N3)-methyltransferase
MVSCMSRNLLRDFFKSARSYIKAAPEGGEVHLTLKDGPPYNGWDVKDMAALSNMLLIKTLIFDTDKFPGYRHQVSAVTTQIRLYVL